MMRAARAAAAAAEGYGGVVAANARQIIATVPPWFVRVISVSDISRTHTLTKFAVVLS